MRRGLLAFWELLFKMHWTGTDITVHWPLARDGIQWIEGAPGNGNFLRKRIASYSQAYSEFATELGRCLKSESGFPLTRKASSVSEKW